MVYENIQKDPWKQVWWRATFKDAATPDMQITIEFLAPEERTTDKQLKTLAVRKLEQMIYNKSIKIKDIEPVET
jgi:hypothetical protein